MPKVKTNELAGPALDWAVAKLERRNPILIGGRVMRMPQSKFHTPRWLSYSTSWEQGGTIIEREGISWHCDNKTSWHAYGYGGAVNFPGPTPLIAAMRCYVASKLGDELELPDGLLC